MKELATHLNKEDYQRLEKLQGRNEAMGSDRTQSEDEGESEVEHVDSETVLNEAGVE